MKYSRRVATPETARFTRRYATAAFLGTRFPALKGRAKFMPTLRVENALSLALSIFAQDVAFNDGRRDACAPS